jgi:hypothetical protein
MSAIKRAVIMIVKGIAGVAAVVFWFWRPTTDTNALVFGVSIIVLLICVAVLSSLDDKFIDKHIKEGYWPSKPINWSPRPGDNGGDKQGGSNTG